MENVRIKVDSFAEVKVKFGTATFKNITIALLLCCVAQTNIN